MALSNRERIDRGLHVLRDGLAPFVEREMDAHVGASWRKWIDEGFNRLLPRRPDGGIDWEIQPLLQSMIHNWKEVFGKTLGHAERSLVGEVLDVRNRWAHQQSFSYDDTHRALDSMERLLRAVSADREARLIEQMRQEVLRTMFAEQRRVEERRRSQLTLADVPKPGLAPWREVVTPHPDVASGRFTLAEFAADLAQVMRGSAGPEYGDPVEFFRRTFMTFGLRRLLTRAITRLQGGEGDPVVELQTTFGGGKTHSMLALWHLAGHPRPADLPGVDQILHELGDPEWVPVRRVAFVGTAFSPAELHEVNGIEVRTVWGKLSAELLGAEGYAMIAGSDRAGTSPGSDLLAKLLSRASPCVILIDEWVAFLRQLASRADLPAGSFEANLTFAQALSEAVKAVQGALLVASLPESDIEVGGEAGRVAQQRLQHTFGRIEASWRPATAEEGYEIVRRRLFEPIVDRSAFARRDAVIKAFLDLYRESGAQFPAEAAELAYRERMERAYPIHPEFFERLNQDWGGLDKFQRTRGLLRLMATIVHSLWEANDRSLLIMPGSTPLDDPAVRARLFDYLPQQWDAVVDADVDGAGALAVRIDRDYPSLGRFGAARRIARAVFIATAPRACTSNPGIEDRRLRLATVQPGESPGVFGDALRRLAEQSSYLYVDGSRYWFSTQPNVRRVAEQIARELDADTVRETLLRMLRELAGRPHGHALQVAPADPADVPDEPELRLVLLPPEAAHHPKNGDGARKLAEAIVTRCGERPRRFRNVLLFVAPDARRLADAEAVARRWLAWKAVLERHDELNLDAFQERQAKQEVEGSAQALREALASTWVWTIAPHASGDDPHGIDFEIRELRGDGTIVERALRRFRTDEAVVDRLGPVSLADTMAKWNLWRDAPHLELRQLAEDFASYLYLPRLASAEVLLGAVREGVNRIDYTFAVAVGVDDAGRYRGLVAGGQVSPALSWLLVKREMAEAQLGRDQSPPPGSPVSVDGEGSGPGKPTGPTTAGPRPRRRFQGVLELGPEDFVKKAGPLWEEILHHLGKAPAARVRVRVVVEAESPEGFDEAIRRTVQENAAALRFVEALFEE